MPMNPRSCLPCRCWIQFGILWRNPQADISQPWVYRTCCHRGQCVALDALLPPWLQLLGPLWKNRSFDRQLGLRVLSSPLRCRRFLRNRGEWNLTPPSSVQVRAASTGCLQAVEPVLVALRSMDVPIGRRSEKQECLKRKKKQKELTPMPVNRKRPRANSNEEADEIPLQKRRTLRPPVSASLTRRLFPLSRRLSSTAVPYSERLKRRQAERQGRIHTTVFRLPELVAQTEADRRASKAEPSGPCPPVPQSSFDFPSENPGFSRTLEEPSRPQEPPRTPERSSGWNIRGLLSSVPRSFSRFIPRFGRSFEGTEESGMFPYCFSTTIICVC